MRCISSRCQPEIYPPLIPQTPPTQSFVLLNPSPLDARRVVFSISACLCLFIVLYASFCVFDCRYLQLSDHKTRSDCWIALEGVVYDISSYLRFHPGGSSILLSVAGRDVSKEFYRHHPWINYRFILEHCRVGILQRHAESPPSSLATPLPASSASHHSAANTTSTASSLLCPVFEAPSGLPQRNIRDPVRLALHQGGPLGVPRENPQEMDGGAPRTPHFGSPGDD